MGTAKLYPVGGTFLTETGTEPLDEAIDQYIYLGHDGKCFFVLYRRVWKVGIFIEKFTLLAPTSGPVEMDLKGHRFTVLSVSNTGISLLSKDE